MMASAKTGMLQRYRGRAAGLVAVCLVCAAGSGHVYAQAGRYPPGSTGSLFGYAGPSPSPGPLLQPPAAPTPRVMPPRGVPRYPYAQLGLSNSQRDAIARIEHDTQQQNQRLLGQIREQQGQLQQLYANDTPDPNKIGQVYERMAGLQRQFIQNNIAAHNEIMALLDADQRRLYTQNLGNPGYGGWGGFR